LIRGTNKTIQSVPGKQKSIVVEAAVVEATRPTAELRSRCAIITY